MTLPDNKILAAVDIGSNSIHLIIARVVHGSLQPIQRYRERVQLAAGLTRENYLDKAAFERGISCLDRIGKIIADHRPDSVRVVATFTVRHARNREDFLHAAEKVLGHPVDVISGREEARLIFQGVAHMQTLEEDVLVVDIGGGSTEFAIGHGFDPFFRESCRMGCVSFRQEFFTRDIDKKAFKKAHTAALQAMEKYLPRLGNLRWAKTFATSGTAKTLQRICSESEDTLPISIDQLREVRDRLISRGSVDWLLELGVDEGRIDLVPGGLAILMAVMDTLNIKEVFYKDVALREGVLYELDEQMRHPDIRVRTRSSLIARYQIDTEFGQMVADTSQWLYDELCHHWFGVHPQAVELLREAAHLHEIGLQISASGLQKHSSYILSNSDLPGYNHDQQQLLGVLVYQHRKRLKPDEIPRIRLVHAEDCLRLIRILRLAIILNISRKAVDTQKLTVSVEGSAVHLNFDAEYLTQNLLMEADLYREQRYWSDVGLQLQINSVS